MTGGGRAGAGLEETAAGPALDNEAPAEAAEAPFLKEHRGDERPEDRTQQRDRCQCCSWSLVPIYVLLVLILLAVAYLIIDPRSPEVEVVGTRLLALRVHTVRKPSQLVPRVMLDIQLALQLSIRNPNVLGFEYERVVSAVGYRGQRIGGAETPTGGVVRPRSARVMTVDLDLVGSDLLDNAAELLADVARRQLPIQANSTIYGAAKVAGLRWRFTVAVDCDLSIDPIAKTLLDKACAAALL